MPGLRCLLVASLLIGHALSTVFHDDFQTQWWITSQIFYVEQAPPGNLLHLRRRRRGVHGNVTSRSFFGAKKAELWYDPCIVDIYMSLSVPFVVPLFTKTKHDDEEHKIHSKKRRRSLEASNRTVSHQLLPLDASTTDSKDWILENASIPETSGFYVSNNTVKRKSHLHSTLADGVAVESEGEIENKTRGNQCPKPENITLRSKRVKRTIFYDDHVASYYLTTHFYINDVFYEVFASYFDMFFPLGLSRPRDSSSGRAFHLVTDDFKMDFYVTVDCPFVVPMLRRSKEEEYFENQLYQDAF